MTGRRRRRTQNSWTGKLKTVLRKTRRLFMSALALLWRILKVLKYIFVAFLVILTIFCCIIYLVENTETISNVYVIEKVANFRTLTGNYDTAFALWTNINRLSRRQFGPTHEKSLNALFQLGSISRLQGRQDEALHFFLKVYSDRRSTLGMDHPETLKALDEMGQTQREFLVAKGVLKKPSSDSQTGKEMSTDRKNIVVENMYKDMLNLSQNAFGELNPQATIYTNAMAHDFYVTGRVEEGLSLLETAYEKHISFHGAAHPDTISTLVVLVDMLCNERRIPEAEKLAIDNFYQQQKLQQHGESKLKMHKDSDLALVKVGRVYLNEQEWLKAEGIFEKVYHFHRSLLGETHKLTVFNLEDFLTAMTRQEDFDKRKASELYKIFLKGFQEIMKNIEAHPDVNIVITLTKVGGLANKLEDFETVLKYSSQLYDILQHEKPSRPERFELQRYALGLILIANFKLGRLDEAEETESKIRQLELEKED